MLKRRKVRALDTAPKTFALMRMEFVVRAVQLSDRLAEMIRNAGEISEFQSWLRASFSGIHYLRRRETLWEKALNSLPDTPLIFIEFGVAKGYIGHYFFTNLLSERPFHWFGFDTFTGLPRAWRGMPPGTFSSDGMVPDLPDGQFRWFKGLVQETMTEDLISEMFSIDGSRILFFDFDLREPTEFVLESVIDLLSVGDLLYFDEAFDGDERAVINQLLSGHRSFEAMGSTATALLLRVSA